METIELIEIIKRGEDSRVQFKQDVTNGEALAGDLVAFSNSKGGRLLIGVDDQGLVRGLSPDDVRRLNQLISNTATNNVRPSISVETDNIAMADGLVMVVSVHEGISKPYCDNKGVYWVKTGADKRRVTSREEIQRLFQASDLVHADEVPVAGTTVGDIDVDHFNEFYERQYGREPDTVEQSLGKLLENLGLARGAALNLAGLLMFTKKPQKYRPELVVKAVSFVGKEPTAAKYRDSEDITGNLKELHVRTMSFLTRNLRRLQGDKGVNTEGELEVPIAALEELVVNMLLHRDYFISAPWRVFIFDDRIELISPGELPNNLTVENIRNGVSIIRNPLIASYATKELPYRGIGTGIRRALVAAPDLRLFSDHDGNLFTATIPRPEG